MTMKRSAPMNKLHLLMFSTLAGICTAATAASFDYDILVVACDANNCAKVAERTLAGGGARTAFQQDDFRLEIEPLALRGDGMDAKVSLDFLPSRRDGGGWLPTAGNHQRVQVLVEPCTLRPGIFSSLAGLASAGRTYRAWVRLAVR